MSSDFEKWAKRMGYADEFDVPLMKYAANEGWNARQPEIDALHAEVARLKADAERLSWLEAHPRLGEIYVNGEAKDCYLYAVSGALGAPLRAIIDAAMSALPDTKGE